MFAVFLFDLNLDLKIKYRMYLIKKIYFYKIMKKTNYFIIIKGKISY